MVKHVAMRCGLAGVTQARDHRIEPSALGGPAESVKGMLAHKALAGPGSKTDKINTASDRVDIGARQLQA